jgi:hypothetical protein
VRTAEVPAGLGTEFRAAVLGAPARLQTHLNSRFVGAYTVAGLRCAAVSFPVRDHGTTVAAFVVLDAELLSHPPGEWHPCPPVPPAQEAGRVEALRELLADLVNAAAGSGRTAG